VNKTSDQPKMESSEVAEKIAVQSDKKLRKALSFQDLFFLSMGGIIGSGWLLGVAAGASIAGPGAVLSWIIGGVIVLFIALTFAEISSAVPKTGAIARYPHLALGGYTGYIMSWGYFLGAASVPPVEAEATLTYASTYIPNIFHTVAGVSVLTINGIFYAILLLIGFFFLNYFGIRFLGKFNTVATWWKFIIPLLTFVLLLFLFNGSNFTAYNGFFPTGISSVFFAIPAAGILFSYLGFRQALEYGGEAKNPKRDIPRATVYSVVAAIVLYTALQIVFIGAIRWSAGGVSLGAWTTIGPANALGSSPFFTELKYSGIAGIVAFSYFLLIDAWISPSGTGWIYEGNAQRVAYGIAADGIFPKLFLRVTDKYRIPLFALLLSLFVGMLFLLPFPSWYLFVGFITSATVLTYVIGPLALHAFRKHTPELKKPYNLKGASIIAPIAFIGAALIVYWSGIRTLTLVFSTIFVGIPLFYFLYGPTKLGLSKAYSYGVGIAGLIIAIVTEIFAYIYVLYPSSSVSLSANTEYFIIVWLIQMILIVSTTLITQSKVKAEDKIMFRSSYWLLVLIFGSYLVSYFGAFGYAFEMYPSATPLLAFPYDTLLMIVVFVIVYIIGLRATYKTGDLTAIVEEQKEPELQA
jgi:amino acid transporter